jgi:HAD superfamily hydrolase (TIGR01549 family)
MGDLHQRVNAVLFDFGETLFNFGRIDTARLFAEGSAQSYRFLQQHGQAPGSFRRYRWRSLLSLRVHYWISNLTGRDFDTLELLKKVGSRHGIELEDGQWQQLAWLWYEPLARGGSAEADLAATLGRLKELGLKLGVVSNTFVSAESLDRHMELLGILRFFDVRVYSCRLKFRKPDPRIFAAAAERIGEKFENILFVGDRINTDIRPAVRIGMRAALKTAYTNAGGKPPPQAARIDNIAELPELIGRINRTGNRGPLIREIRPREKPGTSSRGASRAGAGT